MARSMVQRAPLFNGNRPSGRRYPGGVAYRRAGLAASTGGGCPTPAGDKGPHRETADRRPAFRRRACGRACQGGARPPRGRDRLRQQPAERMAAFVRASRHREGDRTPCRQGGLERLAASVARGSRTGPGRGDATPGIPRACMAGVETRQRADRVFSERRLRRAGLRLCCAPARCPAGANAMSMPRLAHADDRTGVRGRLPGGHGAGQIRARARGQTPPSVPAVRIRPCPRRQLALVMRP